MTQIHGRLDTEAAMKTTVSEVSGTKDLFVLLILSSYQRASIDHIARSGLNSSEFAERVNDLYVLESVLLNFCL